MKHSLSNDQAHLHAYVDGQLDAETTREVENLLASDASARKTVQDYQHMNALLRQHYQPVLDEEIPQQLLNPPKAGSTSRPWFRQLAVATVLLCVGAVSGFLLGQSDNRETLSAHEEANYVVSEAAMAYNVYTPDVRHPVEVSGEQREHLLSWLSKRIGQNINAPDLQRFNLALLGGRLITSEDGPGALLMYENPHGERIIIYLCISDEKPSALRFDTQHGVAVYHWNDKTLTYAIAAETSKDELLPVARSVYDQISF